MAKLGLKIFLLVAIVALGNALLFHQFHLPFGWGNDNVYAKEVYWEKHKDDFNTIFIGTSRVYRQMDATLFDSLTNHETKSFNFGIAGAAAAEMYFYLNKLLAEDKGKLKFVVLELCDVDVIAKENLHTRDQKYWYNFSAWRFSVHAILQSNYSLEEKATGILYNSISFGESILKFDLLKDVWKFRYSKPNELFLGENKDGFVPMEDVKVNKDFVLGQRKEFLSDTNINANRREVSIETFKPNAQQKFISAHYNKLNGIVSKLQAKGIQVFVVLAPRMKEMQYKNTVPVFAKLDSRIKINLADASLHPEFYEWNLDFDAGHVNKEGSRILTRKLAEAFLHLKTDKP